MLTRCLRALSFDLLLYENCNYLLFVIKSGGVGEVNPEPNLDFVLFHAGEEHGGREPVLNCHLNQHKFYLQRTLGFSFILGKPRQIQIIYKLANPKYLSFLVKAALDMEIRKQAYQPSKITTDIKHLLLQIQVRERTRLFFLINRYCVPLRQFDICPSLRV